MSRVRVWGAAGPPVFDAFSWIVWSPTSLADGVPEIVAVPLPLSMKVKSPLPGNPTPRSRGQGSRSS